MINVSTITGFLSFNLYQSLLEIFSKTLQQNANGLSEGNISLSPEEINNARNIIQYLDVINGDTLPNGVSEIGIEDFRIRNITMESRNILLNGRDATRHYSKLEMEIFYSNGATVNAGLNLGSIIIKEGLASSVEGIISKQNADLPIFPYFVLEKISEFITGMKLSKFEICAIATISLMTMEPSYSLIELLKDYSDLKVEDKIEDKLLHLWSKVLPHVEDVYKHINAELDGLIEMQKGRGLIEYAVQYMREQYIKALNQRFKNPIFDLLSLSNLEKMQNLTIKE